MNTDFRHLSFEQPLSHFEPQLHTIILIPVTDQVLWGLVIGEEAFLVSQRMEGLDLPQ